MVDTNYFYLPVGLIKDRRIKQILSLKDGDGIFVTFIDFVCCATKQNDGGKFTIIGKEDLTKEALELMRHTDSDKIERAIYILERYGLIERGDGYIIIKEWDNFQPPEVVGDNGKS